MQARIDENNNSMQGYKIKLENKNANADKIKAELEKVTNEYNQKAQRAKMLLDLEKNMEGFRVLLRRLCVRRRIRHFQVFTDRFLNS